VIGKYSFVAYLKSFEFIRHDLHVVFEMRRTNMEITNGQQCPITMVLTDWEPRRKPDSAAYIVRT
jgi:hypothetical protein